MTHQRPQKAAAFKVRTKFICLGQVPPKGERVIMRCKNIYRRAYIRPEADGRIYVSCFIEYGEGYGRNYCDSGTYKSETGAVRKAAGFLA